MAQTTFHAMGSPIRVIVDDPAISGIQLLKRVRPWFQAWEKRFSRFDPDSELSRLNYADGQASQVSAEMWTVIEAAMAASEQTDGLVTAAILPALEAAGYDRSFEKIAPSPVRTATAVQTDQPIQYDPAVQTIRLPAGMRLDLGGFIKGWAADQAVARLGSYGPALVDAGGDIAVRGPRAGNQPWQIGIADPFQAGRLLCQLALEGGGVATSGRHLRQWGQGGHHLIDPRHGLPSRSAVLSASVIADSALAAEIAAKAALLMGPSDGPHWLRRHQLAGLLVLEDGALVAVNFPEAVQRA